MLKDILKPIISIILNFSLHVQLFNILFDLVVFFLSLMNGLFYLLDFMGLVSEEHIKLIGNLFLLGYFLEHLVDFLGGYFNIRFLDF